MTRIKLELFYYKVKTLKIQIFILVLEYSFENNLMITFRPWYLNGINGICLNKTSLHFDQFIDKILGCRDPRYKHEYLDRDENMQKY